MSNYKPLPEQSRLRELLSYDKETGVFTWRVDRRGTAKAGTRAGHTEDTGYETLRVDGVKYRSSRLAWRYVYGTDPGELQVDHRNQIRTDNSIRNLRVVDNSLNQRNRRLFSNNTSGVTGVTWSPNCRKWAAQIEYKDELGKRKHITFGFFDDWFEAVCARKSGNNTHGFTAIHGQAA